MGDEPHSVGTHWTKWHGRVVVAALLLVAAAAVALVVAPGGEMGTTEVVASETSSTSTASTTVLPPLDENDRRESPSSMVTSTTAPAPAATSTSAPRQAPSSNGAMPPDAVVGAESVTLTVWVEANRVKEGDTINGTLTAINNSTDPVDITHPSGCHVFSGLYFDGERRTEGSVCPAAVVPDELAPGETRTWEFAVRARGALKRFDDAGEHEYQRVPPGVYDLFTGINIGGTWYAPPVTIEVTA